MAAARAAAPHAAAPRRTLRLRTGPAAQETYGLYQHLTTQKAHQQRRAWAAGDRGGSGSNGAGGGEAGQQQPAKRPQTATADGGNGAGAAGGDTVADEAAGAALEALYA